MEEENQDPGRRGNINPLASSGGRRGRYIRSLANKPTASGQEIDQEPELPEWLSWLEDIPVLGEVVDFFGDAWTVLKSGKKRANQADATAAILGDYATEEDIERYLKAVKAAENMPDPDELIGFQRIMQEEGGGAWAVMKALYEYPSVAPLIMLQSFASMTSESALVSAGGAGAAAATNPITAPFALNAALGTASATTDALLTTTDLIKEYMQENGIEFNKENLSSLLQNDKVISSIRTKAKARGAAIGVVDALTLSASKAISGSVRLASGSKVLAGGAAALSEAAGGSTGEFLGQVVAGQEIDSGEILLEGIAELGGPGTIATVVQTATEATGITGKSDTQAQQYSGASTNISGLPKLAQDNAAGFAKGAGLNEQQYAGLIPVFQKIQSNIVNMIATKGEGDATMTMEELQLYVPEYADKVVMQMQENGMLPEGVDVEAATESIKALMYSTITETNNSTEVFHSQQPEEFIPDLPEIVGDSVSQMVKAGVTTKHNVVAENQDIIVEEVTNEINAAKEAAGEGVYPVPQIPNIIKRITERFGEEGITIPGIDNDSVQPIIKAAAEHVVNRIVPNGAVRPTPWNQVMMEKQYAEENSVFPGQGEYTIGPNQDSVSKDGLINWVNKATPQELVSTPMQITNDDAYFAYVQEKKDRAVIDLSTPDIPNRDKIIDLQYQADQIGSDSIPSKLQKAELEKRAKNLTLGLPEREGIERTAFQKKPKDETVTRSKREVAEEKLEGVSQELIDLGQDLHEGKIDSDEYRQKSAELLAKRKVQNDVLFDKVGRPRKEVKNQESTAEGFKARAKSGQALNDAIIDLLNSTNSGLSGRQKQKTIKAGLRAQGDTVTLYRTISTNDPKDKILKKVVSKSELKGDWTLIPEALPNSVVAKATIKISDLSKFRAVGKVAVTPVNDTAKLSEPEYLEVKRNWASAKRYTTKLKDLGSTKDAKVISSLFQGEMKGLINPHFYENFGPGEKVFTAPTIEKLISQNQHQMYLVKLADIAGTQGKKLQARMDKLGGKNLKGKTEKHYWALQAYNSLIDEGVELEPLAVVMKATKYGIAEESIVVFGDGNYAVLDKNNAAQTMLVDGNIDGHTLENWADVKAEEEGAAIPLYRGERTLFSPRHASAKLRITQEEFVDKHGNEPITIEKLNNLVVKRNAELNKPREITLEARGMNAYVQDFIDLLENPEMLHIYPHFAYEVYEKVSRNPEFSSKFPKQENLQREDAQTWIQRIFDPGRRGQNTDRLNTLQQFWNEETGLGRAITWNNSYLQAMEEIAIENSDIGIDRVYFNDGGDATTYGSYSFPIDGKRGVIAPQLSLNATNQKPDTISHELAHAWHQVTMYDRPAFAEKVKQLTQDSYGPRILEEAMDQGLYQIITIDGRTDEAFAMMMGREVTRLLYANSTVPKENSTSKAKQLHKLNDLREEVQNWTIDDIKTIQDLAKVVAVETYLGETVIYGDYIDLGGEVHKLGFDFSVDNRIDAGGYAYNKLIKRSVRNRNNQNIYGQNQIEKTPVELSYQERFEAFGKEELVEDFKAEVEAEYGMMAELKAAIGEKDYWGIHLGTLDKELDSIIEEIGPAQAKRLVMAVFQRDMWQGFEKDIIMNMFKKLQHVEMEKTPIDQDFDVLVKNLATEAGDIVISRVIMIDEEFNEVDFADVGSSWSVDPSFPDYWIDSHQRAGAQGYTPYVFYTKVNLNDPNVIPVGQYEGTTQSEIVITDPSVLKELDWNVRDPKKVWRTVESHSTRPKVENKGIVDRGFLERTIKSHNTKKQKAADLKVDERTQEQKVKDLDNAKLKILDVIQQVQKKYAKSNSQRKREIANIPAEATYFNVAKAFQGISDFDNLGGSLERLGRLVIPQGIDEQLEAELLIDDEADSANAVEISNEKLEARKTQLRINVSAGWQIYEGLEAAGLVGIDVGWKGNDPFTVTIENDKVMLDLVRSAGFETAEKGAWTKIQPETPAPFTGFIHEETGLPLISNADKSARQQPQPVLDVVNTASAIPYETHNELLGIYEQLETAGLMAIEESGVDLDALTPKAKREYLKGLDSKVLEYQFILNEAKSARKMGVFHEMHRYDFRGRLYATPSYFNHQGSKLALSLFQFANKEPIGATGWKWMLIQATDMEGKRYDSNDVELTLLDQRYKYAETQLDKWLDVAKDPMSEENLAYWQGVDEPFLFLATILEIKNAIESGNPLAYKSGLPIHMDATNSGGQVLVALMKDIRGARVANMLPDGIRGDLYNEVGQGVLAKLPEITAENQAILDEVTTEMERHWNAIENAKNKAANKEAFTAYVEWKKANKEKVKLGMQLFWSQPAMRENIRKIVKGPVMTKYYSAGVDTMAEQLLKKFKHKYPGLTIDQARFLAAQLEKEANAIMPGPAELMRLFQTLAGRVSKTEAPISVHAPLTGFHMVQNPRMQEQIKQKLPYTGANEKISGRSTNDVISVALRVGNTGLDAKKAKSSIAPNLVHMLDSQIVAWLLLNAGYDVQTIHDSFGSSPANAEQLYNDIRTAFIEIFEGDTLKNMLEEMVGPEMTAKELAKLKHYDTGLDITGIAGNEFAFSAGKGFKAPKELTVTQKVKKEKSFKERAMMDMRSEMEADILERTKPCRI